MDQDYLADFFILETLETTNKSSIKTLKEHISKVSKSCLNLENKKCEYYLLTVINFNDEIRGVGSIELMTSQSNQIRKVNMKHLKPKLQKEELNYELKEDSCIYI